MLRPVRTVIVMMVVFLAGLFYERHQQSARCAAAGGTVQDGLCRGDTG